MKKLQVKRRRVVTFAAASARTLVNLSRAFNVCFSGLECSGVWVSPRGSFTSGKASQSLEMPF